MEDTHIMGNRGGVFGFGSDFEDPLGIRDSEDDDIDFFEKLQDLFGESAKTGTGKKFFDSINKKLLMETGVTPELARLLNPDITVDYGEAFDKEVVAHANLQLEYDAVTKRLDSLLPAIARQSLAVVARFEEIEKEHRECHEDWSRERTELERALRLERREATLFRSTTKDLDRRLRGMIADLTGTEEIPSKESIVEFLESLRDTVQDAYDEYRYPTDRNFNSDVVRPKPRSQQREEAKARAEAVQDPSSDEVASETNDTPITGDRIPEGTFDGKDEETSPEGSNLQADAATS